MTAPRNASYPYSVVIATSGVITTNVVPRRIGSRAPTGPRPLAWTKVAMPPVKMAHWSRNVTCSGPQPRSSAASIGTSTMEPMKIITNCMA